MGKKKGGGVVRVKQVGPKKPPVLPTELLNPMEALQIPRDEMVHLPPTPDRSYQIFWPVQETFGMKTDDFQVIYPSYLDSTKTIKQGRRISSEKAVPTPTVSDMSQSLQSMNVRHVIQPHKGYSRDITCQWDNPGRLLVDVSNYKKTELLLEVATRIPLLPARIDRLKRQAAEEERKRKEEEEKKIAEEQEARKAAAAAAAASKSSSSKTTGASSSSSNKKKGKKGKRK